MCVHVPVSMHVCVFTCVGSGRALANVCLCVSQVQWMEEKLKAPEGQSGDSELRLFRRCQELQCLLQEKEEVISLMEQQLEEQVWAPI